MYTPRNNSQESKHPVFVEFDNLFKKDFTTDKREELIFNLYKRNIEFMNDLNNAKTNISISKLIELKIVYIRVLDGKGEYRIGKPIADQLKILVGRLDRSYKDYDMLYINANKWIAINLGRLKKYRASNLIFKELIKVEEYKEFYQDWISYNTAKIISFYAYFLLGFFFLFAFRKEFFGLNVRVPLILNVLIVTIIILNTIYILFSEKIVSYFVRKIYK